MTYLYQTLSVHDFCDAFNRVRADEFSYEGLVALYNYLVGYAVDNGSPLELDVIALCCEFSESRDLAEFNQEHGTDYAAIEEIEERTTVIRIDSEAFLFVDF